MRDALTLFASALFILMLGVVFIAMNSSGNVGPYFMAGLCFLYATLAINLARKEVRSS